MVRKNLQPEALRRGRRGCLDALMIDRAAVREARVTCYRKTFDLVPHEWLKTVVKAIRAPLEMRRSLIRKVMPLWKTDVVVVQTREGRAPSDLQEGIYQGDSLSPLLFCFCVAPLLHRLRKQKGFASSRSTGRMYPRH